MGYGHLTVTHFHKYNVELEKVLRDGQAIKRSVWKKMNFMTY